MSSLQQGPTLRALLEDPNLVNPPKPADDGQKKKEADAEPLFSSQSAFLGPNLWDKTLSLDFELEYMDLDEFLTENDSTTPSTGLLPELGLTTDQLGIQFPIPDSPPRLLNDVSSLPGIDPMSLLNVSQPSPVETTSVQQQPKKAIHIKRERTHSRSLSASLGECSQLSSSNDAMNDESEDVDDIEVAVEVPIDPVDIALATVPGATEFDPRRARFSDQDLRPQPMLRKSKKVFVCDEEKDDKYWNRRKKNNVAAKRSRDARRIKENQIALRATFLEKENEKLKEELRLSLLVNKDLVARLSKYEDTSDN